jgi:hypothetical protein
MEDTDAPEVVTLFLYDRTKSAQIHIPNVVKILKYFAISKIVCIFAK